MKSRHCEIKLFLSIALVISVLAFLWLVFTSSTTDNLFISHYSWQHLILICISGVVLVSVLLGLIFSTQKWLIQIFNYLMTPRKVFFIIYAILLTLFVFVYALILNSPVLHTMIIVRSLPIFLLFFLLFTEVVVFQRIVAFQELKELSLDNFKFNESNYLQDNGRDLRLDFLRGLFVLVMIIDHISKNSPLYYLTSGNKFFTSAAEGFFLVSGIVTGLVYFKVIQRKGLKAGVIKAFKRAGTIYLISVGVNLLTSFFAEHFDLFFRERVNLANPIRLVLNILDFKIQYQFADVLIVYCLLFLLLPIALLLLNSHKAKWLFAISLGLYIFYLFFPQIMTFPIRTFVNFFGIQLFFFGGVLLGYNHILENIQNKIKTSWVWVTGSLFFLLIILWNVLKESNPFSFLAFSMQTSTQINQFFDRPSVAPGRFVASFVVFGFLYFLLTLQWVRIKKWAGWLILPLGQNALFAYTAHLVLIIMYSVIAKLLLYNENSFWINGFVQLGSVFIIWFCIKNQLFTPQTHNRKIYYVIPGILIIAFLLFETATKFH